MNKKILHITTHYTPLFAIILACFIGFLISPYDKIFRISLTVAGSIGYFTWGVVHHYLHKDLDLMIVVEYLSIAIFGAITFILVILRA